MSYFLDQLDDVRHTVLATKAQVGELSAQVAELQKLVSRALGSAQVNQDAVHDLVAEAMCVGAAYLSREIAAQEYHPSTPVSEILRQSGYPATWLAFRTDLTEALTEAS